MANASRRSVVLGLMGVAAVSACSKADDKNDSTDSSSTSADATGSAAPTSGTSSTTSSAAFDISSVPVSTATLGEFPYLELPSGYTNKGFGVTDKASARFPFWVNGTAHWVNGRFHGEDFSVDAGKDYSADEVTQGFDAEIRRLGGVRVSSGRIPNDVIKGWGDEITQGFVSGLGDVYNYPATVWIVRRPESNIWVHMATTTASGGFVVGQESSAQTSSAS
ncbi:hypothetical protein [Calidifontibacter indicus]|uniref:hypothetical protein n=1 Tax=Calidifontibacter indicus TaxID=419650 RepID=UPI003D75B801